MSRAIWHAYATNADALKAMDGVSSTRDGRPGRSVRSRSRSLSVADAKQIAGTQGIERRMNELADTLTSEMRLIQDLRAALVRQRDGLAADDTAAIEASVQAISRTLLTLDEAHRHRGSLVMFLTGSVTTSLDELGELEARVGHTRPEGLDALGDDVCRAAEITAGELAINQELLRRATDAGEAFLQRLFSSMVES